MEGTDESTKLWRHPMTLSLIVTKLSQYAPMNPLIVTLYPIILRKDQRDQKKSPNVYKSYPRMISL